MSTTEAFHEAPLDDHERAYYGAVAAQQNGRGWHLMACRLAHGQEVDPDLRRTLEFVQVGHPDGTSSYFTLDPDTEEGFRAGPFGGGMAWMVPKYVLKQVGQMLGEAFAVEAELEEVES